jgi:hypothetical protein
MIRRAKALLVARSWVCHGRGVGVGEVKRADGALALAHRHAQPRPDPSRDHQLPERRPVSLGAKMDASSFQTARDGYIPYD